ncbi:MAG TPA: SRPBCC family protein [Gammaproteobacteria bacterium]|nr:SRPBCC family protein [Gammaproteobacteria bacterium]
MSHRARTYMRRAALAALALADSAYLCAAQPAAIRSLDITLEDGRYHVVADTYLAAPPAAVYGVLLDYDDDAYGRISEVYKESEYLPPDKDGAPLVFTRVEGCLLFFCRSMRRVERLETVEPKFIRATTLPERSDFKYSVSRMMLEPEGAGTKVIYELDMEPDFWLPPFVGPAFLKRVLMHGGTHAVERIEALAQDLAARRASESDVPTASDALPTTAGGELPTTAAAKAH